jgi:WKF domain
MAPEARIPAWKRLGLKLVGSKRPAEEAFTEDNPQQETTDPKTDQKSHTAKKQKSVSFSNGSKLKDGSTTAHLLDDFISSQQGGSDQFTPEEASLFKVKAQPKPKNSKPSKKAKKKNSKQPSDEPPKTPAYVEYLVQFHTDKEHWKFNKIRQIQLLKHAFDMDPKHTEALLEYLKGLKGEDARNRMKTTAMDIAGLSDDALKTLREQLLNVKVRLREAEDIKDAESKEGRTKLARREVALRMLIAMNKGVPFEEVPAIGFYEKSMNDPNLKHGNPVANRMLEVNTPDGPVIVRKRTRVRKIRTGHPDDDEESLSSVDSIPTAENTTLDTPESSEESSSEEESSEEDSSDESSEEESSEDQDEDMADGPE